MTLLKQIAPVQSCNSDEGINPNITKGMILSNTLTQAEAIVIKGDVWNLTVSQIKLLADAAGQTPSSFWNQYVSAKLLKYAQGDHSDAIKGLQPVAQRF